MGVTAAYVTSGFRLLVFKSCLASTIGEASVRLPACTYTKKTSINTINITIKLILDQLVLLLQTLI